MGIVKSAWGDFMEACNLLMRAKVGEKERKEGKIKDAGKEGKEIKIIM